MSAPQSAPPRPPPPPNQPKVALFEPDDTSYGRAEAIVREFGYKLIARLDDAAFIQRMAGNHPPEIVIVGLPGGASIVEAASELGPLSPVVIGAVDGPAKTARERSVGADLFTLRPHTAASLVPILQAATRLSSLRRRMTAMRGTEKVLRERLKQFGQADSITGLQQLDFFKHYLIMELKRARRFGYALAVCLVGLDCKGAGSPPARVMSELRSQVAASISSAVRDVDSPVDFADDRFLVFLPQTDLDGAENVAHRIVQAVRSSGTMNTEVGGFRMVVSIGIAALEPGESMSFARLLRDASAAMKAARLKGGNRVVSRR